MKRGRMMVIAVAAAALLWLGAAGGAAAQGVGLDRFPGTPEGRPAAEPQGHGQGLDVAPPFNQGTEDAPGDNPPPGDGV